MGIRNFWGMIDMMKMAELSARDMVMMLPPSGRVRCLQALMAGIEATPPPEALWHAMSTSQERVKILNEYRGVLEDILDKFMLSTWRCCARQLFAAADPVRFIGEGGAPAISAGAPAGLSAQVEADNALLRTIDTLPLEKWPSWYAAQYDVLIIQPHIQGGRSSEQQ
jgi:hypothetical protein